MAENAPNRRFCARCGSALPRPCANCGFENEPAAAFCGGCGKPIEAASSAPPITASPAPRVEGAQRRQLTVMFCDLVGSTALSARLDPEDLRAVIGIYHRCVAAVIERAGGFVAKYMGDGVLTYFGYPRADEHDAERAVRAGLALVEAVAGLDTAAEMRLQARVGIATGLVVVGDLIGEGEARERGVVGETPNLAARLQALAEPGTLVIAASTRRLTGGLFDYEDLGAVEIKGLAKPVEAARVVCESGTESRFEALRAARTPLVGRDEELAMLERRWQRAKSGEGCVVLVSGEPGIGKSRRAETLVERLSGEPHTRLRLFCSPHHQDSALYPTITQLERAAGFRREGTADARLDKLEAVLAQATGDISEAAPLLAALLSLPTGERYPPLNLTPQKHKEKTLQALVSQVQGLAARQPVLVLFEDAQWSDPTSLELLDLIIDRVPTIRVLAIITFRPEFTAPWIGRPHVTSLALNRLPLRQRAEMIAGITGGKALPQEVADQIIDRTDGVPLFVEELTKAVVESGTLTDAGDRYTVDGTGAGAGDPGELAGFAPGPARSSGAGARGGADRGGARPPILARADRRLGANAAAATRRRADAAGWRRADLPARHLARRRVPLQARAGTGRRLQHLIAQPPAAASCPSRRHPRRPVSGDRRGPAGSARPPLRGGRSDREGGRLLACRRAAGLGTIDARGSRGAAPPRAGAGSHLARRRLAPGARARSADRARPGADRKPGLGRAGVVRCARSGTGARIGAEPAARADVRPLGPV
jgi:class 3 adenylate cyclase